MGEGGRRNTPFPRAQQLRKCVRISTLTSPPPHSRPIGCSRCRRRIDNLDRSHCGCWALRVSSFPRLLRSNLDESYIVVCSEYG